MAIRDALQSASVKLVGYKPAVFFTSDEEFELQLVDLINDAARDICRTQDWTVLQRTYTISGNGELAEFPLPPDYDRMNIEAELQDPSNWAWGYAHIRNMNEWIYRSQSGFQPYPGGWILFDNKLHFTPPPAVGNQAIFPYISNQRVIGADAVPKTLFTADDDSFVLPEELLMLWLVWRWREQKRLDATNDQANFVKMFNEYATKDGGSKVIRSWPTWRWPRRGYTSMAYPFPLGPGTYPY